MRRDVRISIGGSVSTRMKSQITYRQDKGISAGAIRALFKRNEWYDWFTLKDVEWYLSHSLFVASAWHGRRAVGLAVLTGDGRIGIELDTLLVDESYRRRSIAKALVAIVVEEAKRREPYYFKVEVYEEQTEELYAGFGFQRNEGTWLLEYKGLADRLGQKVRRIRRTH